MKSGSRANVVSSFTIIKGAMIEETYAVFAAWDFANSKRENLNRLREKNFIGASSATWLRDVAKVLNRRFEPDGRDRPLVTLAKSGCDLEEWKPLLLWHMTRDEFLVRDLEHETPWISPPELREESEGLAVCADIRYVAPSHQPDAHEAVVELCELMFAVVPDAELTMSNAVGADGNIAGFGDYQIATKRIKRENSLRRRCPPGISAGAWRSTTGSPPSATPRIWRARPICWSG